MLTYQQNLFCALFAPHSSLSLYSRNVQWWYTFEVLPMAPYLSYWQILSNCCYHTVFFINYNNNNRLLMFLVGDQIRSNIKSSRSLWLGHVLVWLKVHERLHSRYSKESSLSVNRVLLWQLRMQRAFFCTRSWKLIDRSGPDMSEVGADCFFLCRAYNTVLLSFIPSFSASCMVPVLSYSYLHDSFIQIGYLVTNHYIWI